MGDVEALDAWEALAPWLWQWDRGSRTLSRGVPQPVTAGASRAGSRGAWEIGPAAFLRGRDHVSGGLPEPILPDFPPSARLPTNQAGLRSGVFSQVGLLRSTLHVVRFRLFS